MHAIFFDSVKKLLSTDSYFVVSRWILQRMNVNFETVTLFLDTVINDWTILIISYVQFEKCGCSIRKLAQLIFVYVMSDHDIRILDLGTYCFLTGVFGSYKLVLLKLFIFHRSVLTFTIYRQTQKFVNPIIYYSPNIQQSFTDH